jgi:hypothetical protein
MFIVVIILLLILFGKNSNYATATSPVILDAHQSPLASTPSKSTVGPVMNTLPPQGGPTNIVRPVPPMPTRPVSQLLIAKETVPVTGIVGRQTQMPENGGTFFSNNPRFAALYRMAGGKVPNVN